MTQTPPGPSVGQGRRPAIRRSWPRLPAWFWAGAAVATVVFLVFVGVALSIMGGIDEQPLFERRSAPVAGRLSHDTGEVALPDVPARPVECGAITGLKIRAADAAADLLTDAMRGLCDRLAGVDPALADRILEAAKAGAEIGFASFERTGEFSTTVAGSPPRVVLNDAFLVQFKGFLLPVLAHELWHAGRVDVTAEDELAARRIEAAMCAFVPSSTVFRGCNEAREFVELPAGEALAGLRAAGYR